MSSKIGVYVSDNSEKIMAAMAGPDASTSGVINSIIERYWWVCQASLPELTTAEWQALLNVYTGSDTSSYSPPYRIANDMMDNRGEVDLAALSDRDPEYATLVRKMHALSQVEQCAVLDFCQRFWAGDWDGFSDFDAIKAALTRYWGPRAG